MQKRVIIAHGWDGYPEEGWFPWLKHELETRGFAIFVPQLPDPANPHINTWVPKLAEVVGSPDAQTYFVGHSVGCQTIARYLSGLPKNTTVGGAVFVAGFFKRLTNLEDDEEVRAIAKEWIETPLDLQSVKSHLTKSVAIFSDDDPFVPLDNQYDFRDKLDSKIIIEHQKGHFSGPRDKTTEAPAILNAFLEMTNCA